MNRSAGPKISQTAMYVRLRINSGPVDFSSRAQFFERLLALTRDEFFMPGGLFLVLEKTSSPPRIISSFLFRATIRPRRAFHKTPEKFGETVSRKSR